MNNPPRPLPLPPILVLYILLRKIIEIEIERGVGLINRYRLKWKLLPVVLSTPPLFKRGGGIWRVRRNPPSIRRMGREGRNPLSTIRVGGTLL
jgi:hypothetical protein